jgi:hypothetical protein
MRRLPVHASLIAALGATVTAHAHHSQAAFNLDPAAIEAISGTVTRFDFRNPHVYLYIERADTTGATAVWELEASSTPNLIRRGWSADSVRPGDVLTIDMHPAKAAEQRVGRIDTIHFADGRTLSVRGEGVVAPRDASLRATSLAGRWLGRYGLTQVGQDLDQWPLTAKGRAAQRSYDGSQNPQIDCIPVTAPTVMLYSNIYDVSIAPDRVSFLGEWMNVERTVYLDGRAHPPAGERSLQGHSIGRWQDGVLVVDTANFTAHGAGNAFEVPSGLDKHVVERFALSADGKRIDYTFTLEDPEYLTEAIEGAGSWDYRPDLTPQPATCDPEVARRFLER